MKNIVITGSTRGIGYGLAESFLNLGCRVMISGRKEPGVEKALAQLSSVYDTNRVEGYACDVTRFDQVQMLWEKARERFGKVDIWINNAGISHPQRDFWDAPPQELHAVVDTNITGVMYGAKVALRGMLEQGFGSLYNMEGLGSDGRRVTGLTAYGSTKRLVRYLTDGLATEMKGSGVLVGALSPGMVVTEFLTGWYDKGSAEWERAKRVFNVLADKVETVTPWLAKEVLDNRKNGARIVWLGGGKVLFRFLVAPFRKRDLFGTESGPM
jgi:NAD(P)-dependent dehydrogenase (short-subunit alcohol dehydrogenase family)